VQVVLDHVDLVVPGDELFYHAVGGQGAHAQVAGRDAFFAQPGQRLDDRRVVAAHADDTDRRTVRFLHDRRWHQRTRGVELVSQAQEVLLPDIGALAIRGIDGVPRAACEVGGRRIVRAR